LESTGIGTKKSCIVSDEMLNDLFQAFTSQKYIQYEARKVSLQTYLKNIS